MATPPRKARYRLGESQVGQKTELYNKDFCVFIIEFDFLVATPPRKPRYRLGESGIGQKTDLYVAIGGEPRKPNYR